MRGLATLVHRNGAGRPVVYDAAARARILREVQRAPDRERDRTATWSLTTLQRADVVVVRILGCFRAWEDGIEVSPS